MRRILNLAAYLFFCATAAAQGSLTPPGTDTAWFESYFSRYTVLLKKKPALAIDSLEKIKLFAASKNYYPAINRYYLEKAAWFVSNKKNDSAVSAYQSAIQLAKKENRPSESGNAYLALANLYQFNGNTLSAAENYLHATKLLKNLGRKRTLVGLYRNLLTVLNRLQQKNGGLQNMLTALITSKSSESGLVKIINTKSSEEEGFNFPDQSLVKEVGGYPVHVILGNAKFMIPDQETLGKYGSLRDVQLIPAGTLLLIPDFPRNGSIMREFSDDPKVYIAKDSQLYHIASPDVLENYGGWDAVYYVPNNSLSSFPKSPHQVTVDNVNTVFNLNQEFDILTDSIQSALQKNTFLSNELSRTVADRNNALQKRKSLLWASAVGLAALLLIVFLLIRNFRQKQKINAQTMQAFKAAQELQRKMELEKERTRIATDIHDDLGSGLSRIRYLGETVRYKTIQQENILPDIEKISHFSDEMVDKMNEIVWALNEKNDTLEAMVAYIRSFATEYLSASNLQCQVVLPDEIPYFIIKGETRRNIFLSVKECLHNIVKHAEATEASLTIAVNRQMIIHIKDNGKGINWEKIRPFSNGMINIKKRMKDTGGTVEFNNEQGTTVILKVPLL